MEPEVRYVSSRGGTRIAYSVIGDGPPLLWLSGSAMSHLRLYPRLPGAQEFIDRLGRGRRLIRADLRGCGMAERNVEDHSADAVADDAEAIIDALHITTVDVVAGVWRAEPAVRLARRRPGCVRKLVLISPGATAPDPAEFQLLESNWDTYLELRLQRGARRPLHELRETVAHVNRCTDQKNDILEMRAALLDTPQGLGPEFGTDVLGIELAHDHIDLAARQRTFEERYPGGRFLRLPAGSWPPPQGSRPGDLLDAIEEFFGPPVNPEQGSRPPLSPRESEVLRLLVAGRTQPEIAEDLVLSPATVSRHVTSIYAKLGVHRRGEAVAHAIRNGLD